MNSRRRVIMAINHQQPDRAPCDDGFWKETIQRFIAEGMPEDARPADYFDFDIEHMYLDASPRLPERLIAEDDEKITYTSKHGYSATMWKTKSGALHYFDHVSATPEGWQRVKQRMVLEVDGAARISNQSYFPPFTPYPSWEGAARQFRQAAETGRFVLLAGYGPGEALWRHHGYVRTLTDYIDDPDLLIEMVNTHTDLVCAVIRKGIEQGIRPDGVLVIDDLGDSRATLIAPPCFRRVLKPCYAKIFDLCREFDLARFMHSDGNIHAILDDLIEVGVQVLNPIDTHAGMDLVDLKKRYGKRLAYYGGISGRDMHDVQKSNAQLDRCVPVASRGGGYIYHSDHTVPQTVSLERYKQILRRVRQLSAVD